MRTNGFFDSKNFDTDEPDIKKALMRQSGGIDITKSFEFEGEVVNVPWKKFTFIGQLNHGLARTTDVLPSDVKVCIRLHRAPSSFLLVKGVV
jgi:hypothetical protein